MKIDNYLSRWEEFYQWSVANRPEIVGEVENLGSQLRSCIRKYRETTDPVQRHEQMEHIKAAHDRVVQWHMREILSKLEGE